MKCRNGFTLIELLVVIAIIAILAAIIFPVFARVKVSAYRSSDQSNMNAIRTALQLYRQDQGGYPPELLGYVTQYAGGPNPTVTDILPANQVVGALFPKRIDSLDTLRPAYVRPTGGSIYTQFTSAVWPNKVNTGSLSDQKYGPADGPVMRCFNPGDGVTPPTGVTAYYYTISGYDVASVPANGAEAARTEIHYAPFWSGYTVADNTDPCNPTPLEMGNAADDPRQLGYSEPPETTVVTWDSFFRDYSTGTLQREVSDIVLFLNGSAKPFDSVNVEAQSWKITAP